MSIAQVITSGFGSFGDVAHVITSGYNVGAAAAIPQARREPATVTVREYSYAALVQALWGSEYHAPDHGAYRFSNDRQFDSTDKTDSGIYE